MKNGSFGFIGGGRVDKILLNALTTKYAMPASVIVSDTNEEALKLLKSQFPSITITQNNSEPAKCDYVFISLHPPMMGPVLKEISSCIKKDAVLISLAPKLSIDKISSLLNGFNRIVRMIPNAPSYINKGYNPTVFSKNITGNEKSELLELFSYFGECPEVNEYDLEAYAIITAMGPTYFWFQINQLYELGLSFGLPEKELRKGIKSMMDGAVETFLNSGLDPKDVIDLIPVKPLAENEETIKGYYAANLTQLFKKLKS